MGHYDNCRDGYCARCGAAPGNMKDGLCEFCDRTPSKPPKTDHMELIKAAAMVVAEQTYVFENVEVRKTGRKAKNKLRSGKIDELVEITPTEQSVGSWKKWVREDVLFEVQN